VHEDTEKHEAQYEEWKAALEICDCGAKFEEAVAAANDAFDAETARIGKERDIAAEAKEDFEKKMAEQISEAAAKRDETKQAAEDAHAKADADKEAAIADMEEQKAAAQTAAEEAIAALDAEIAETREKDQE